MKFTMSTKPFSDALSLGIVNANVSKFHQRSCLAQLSVDKNTLKVNLEAASIYSVITLKGASQPSDRPADASDSWKDSTSIFVDSLLLKQLVSTLDSNTVTLDIQSSGLIIHSGKSKFALPKMVDDDVDLNLRAPNTDAVIGSGIDIDKSGWKFIKEYQMYAIAMSFIHPVYTKVWVGEHGDVLVGDFDNSLFTYSRKGNLGKTCLLSDTIVNLFNSLPDGAKLYTNDTDYVIHVVTDGFEFISQFVPQYESDEDVGDYNSGIIIDMLQHSESDAVKVSTGAINKFLNQAALLSSNAEDTITLRVGDSKVNLKDKNIDCSVSVESPAITSSCYEITFKTSFLKSVISHYLSNDFVFIAPTMQEEVVVGVVFWNDELTTVLAGTD